MGNLDIWDRYSDIDPKFTKPITGKPYRGTSPNPQYVIQCLTDIFGPVGQGFGWEVASEEWREVGGETIHWCRIRFWHTDRANVFDSYGQTRAAYVTNNGKQIVDEDAPKKSLTDAIIKASSYVGIAANIFLGRWDDQKYVEQVNIEYREKERPVVPSEVLEAVSGAATLESLGQVWSANREWQTHPDFLKAKDDRKLELASEKSDAI